MWSDMVTDFRVYAWREFVRLFAQVSQQIGSCSDIKDGDRCVERNGLPPPTQHHPSWFEIGQLAYRLWSGIHALIFSLFLMVFLE